MRAVLLEPEDFRRFHLRRNPAADVLQYGMSGGVNLLRLADGAVIHPDDDVAVRIVGRPDRQRLSVFTNHD